MEGPLKINIVEGLPSLNIWNEIWNEVSVSSYGQGHSAKLAFGDPTFKIDEIYRKGQFDLWQITWTETLFRKSLDK